MKNIFLLIPAFAVILFINTASILSSSGKAGYTNSPGEGNCTSCHSDYNVNSGSGSVAITSDIPASGYEPNTTYHLEVTVSHTGATLFGFDLECLSGTSTYANAGSFTITNASESQISTNSVNGVSRNNVIHVTNGGLANDTKSFAFNWLSPASDVGDVTFYVAGLAADNNGGKGGDYVYTTSKVVSYASPTSIDKITKDASPIVFFKQSHNTLHVEYQTKNYQEAVSGKIYSLEGRIVESVFNIFPANGEINKDFDLHSPLSKGIYIFTLQQNRFSFSTKLFID